MGKDPSEYPDRGVRVRRRLRNFRRRLIAALLRPVLFVAERTPHRLFRAVARVTLEPVFHLAVRRRSLHNLERALGDSTTATERRRIAREVSRSFVDYACEFLALLRLGERLYAGRIDDGEARAAVAELQRATEQGYVGVTAHLGNWELLGHWVNRVSARGLGAVVGKRLSNPYLNALVERQRRRLGLETLYRDDPPTKMIRILRAGAAIAVVPDQDVKLLSGVFVDFFGRRAYTPTGPARLALAARVPIVCSFCVRTEGGFRVIFSTPIHPRSDRPRGEEILRLTAQWSRQVEQVIREHPGQWAWFHDRWKTTPEKLRHRGRETLPTVERPA